LTFRFSRAQRFFPVLFPTGLRPESFRKNHAEKREHSEEKNYAKVRAARTHGSKLWMEWIDANQMLLQCISLDKQVDVAMGHEFF
jgi:hypothetical protein